MATKYDAFELLYKNRAPMKPIEVVKQFDKGEENYHVVHKLLRSLVEDKILIKIKDGFEINNTKKTELLHGLIQYCLKNNIDYNLLLDKNLVEFISYALQKEEVTSKEIKIHPRTLEKYIQRLNRSGLLLIISKKPLRAKLFYNVLLNNLLIYFGYKHKVVTESSINYIPEIKKELIIYKKLKKENMIEYKKIVREFEISFVHHSLALEGNPITLPDTFKILKDNVIPAELKGEDIDEVKNYQNAILKMLKDAEDKKPLTLQVVLDYHKLSMAHRQSMAGKIRDIGVFIKWNQNFKITKVDNIKKELRILFEKYNEFLKKKGISIEEILAFAVYFHNEFQYIHPFEDGNSRTTRLITFHLLQSKGIPILDIPVGLLDEYLSYTKGSKKRDDEKLFGHLQRVILFNLKKINERLA
ncbi:MAG: Fic family protein [Nanoarchaeota archaeon]|nr:Fic family protein [Nanoarchaeota archaeon]